jgi:predicted RNA-binding Zn-ribbon protein involved in translation (DUF1610 family)
MANLKLLGGLVTLGGFIGFILAATADSVGLSINAPDYFGPVQYAFVAIGIVIAIVGVIIMVIPSRTSAKADEAISEDEEIEAEEYECPSCGATVSADDTSCSECGEVFEREEFECPSCGAIVEADATSCPECGEEFELEDESAAPPAGAAVTRSEPETAEEEEGDEYECPSCGAAVGEDDAVCPNCGEEFE